MTRISLTTVYCIFMFITMSITSSNLSSHSISSVGHSHVIKWWLQWKIMPVIQCLFFKSPHIIMKMNSFEFLQKVKIAIIFLIEECVIQPKFQNDRCILNIKMPNSNYCNWVTLTHCNWITVTHCYWVTVTHWNWVIVLFLDLLWLIIYKDYYLFCLDRWISQKQCVTTMKHHKILTGTARNLSWKQFNLILFRIGLSHFCA